MIKPFIIAQWLLGLAVMSPSIAHAADVSSSGLSNIVIDEINILGVTIFSSNDVEKLVELSPGDRIDRAKIVQTAKNLQGLYHSGGYDEVKIETRLVQKVSAPKAPPTNILEIAVSEGRPTRIAGIKVVYDLPVWQTKLEAVSEKIGMKPGDIYDHEKLLNGYRSLQDALTGYDFLSSKVEDSDALPGSPEGLNLPKEILEKTAKWVSLTVKVTLGDRVTFSYRDNTVFTNGQLSSWIDEQRLLGFSHDYIDRIKSRFDEEYRKLGYDKVEIGLYTFEDQKNQRRNITFAFKEGPRVEVDDIVFDGNSVFSSGTLYDKFEEFASPTLSRNYYVAKDVQKAADVLVEWMKSQGYLAAKLVSISRTYLPRGDRVNLVIYLYEGEQTITETVRIHGRGILSQEEIQKILGVAPGMPLNLYAFNEGLEALKSKYRDLGYLDFAVKNEGTPRLVAYSQENRAADVTLDLDEGTQYRVSRIEVDGIRKTKLQAVIRELELKEGDILSEGAWLRSEARLRRLGIFATVSIKAVPDPDRPDGKVLKVYIEEGSPGLIAGGAGVRNDLGIRAFSQIQYSNLWGRNHTIQLSAVTNRRLPGLGADFCASEPQKAADAALGQSSDHCFLEYDVSLGYIWPWFMLGDTSFRPSISVDRSQYSQFDADTSTFEAKWEKPIIRDWGLVGSFAYTLEFIHQKNANLAADEQSLQIGSITPTIVLDRRDNPLAPSKGTFTSLQFDLARPQFGSQNNPPEEPPVAYWRFQGRSDFYFPLPRGINAYFSFRTGLEYNLAKPPEGAANASRYAIPLIKQFTLGGVGSLRGFKEQALAIPETQAVSGSLTYVNYRGQVEFPFAGAMKFVPFVDAANLILDNYSYAPSTMRYGAGAGLHYKSPVGSVNFDVGVNVKPRPGEDDYRIHFSIGNI